MSSSLYSYSEREYMIETKSTDHDDRDDDRDDEHLEEVADGCGCVEVWEHLSEQRERDQ